MVNELIRKARAKKNKYFDDNIEIALENIENLIMVSAEKGKGFTEIRSAKGKLSLTHEVLLHDYTDKFIEVISDHFEIDKTLIKKYFTNYVDTNGNHSSKLKRIEIFWGDEFE